MIIDVVPNVDPPPLQQLHQLGGELLLGEDVEDDTEENQQHDNVD
eukprot:CAMPEP_0170291614 /NCGR_PEP_ID=MMETSP0116_2-20130129/45900_1 /TAXON_ID=400756 /ORGANISM="Durinskia baltica, Strain CSIRO CS-38" /LENGTH=44 /DNA_ID= /DNA_START= /DNA_END= /DNA_ORIENTATION=